ncbi:MAG TPA: divergent polysaccharide deacetylase family protein [Thermoanaerobaculia bacterium]|jgi:hypothetical protein
MLIPVAGLLVLLLVSYLRGGSVPDETLREITTTVISSSAPRQPAVEAEALPKVTPKKLVEKRAGDIVLIIDDLGFQGQPIDRVMALDPNINASILPNGNDVAGTAKRFNARGFEVLCHLPMEPLGSASPGRGAILTSMSDDEIARLTRESISAVPHARGVNNHMGSRATADRRVMQTVLGAIPGHMYFIDSKTSGQSIAFAVAKEMNVRSASRDVFLDDVQSEAAVRKQLAMLADEAHEHGRAIGIGHPYAVTMRVLADELPNLRARGFRFVRASEVVR